MPPRRDPVPRAREAAHWLAGIALLGILGAGVVGAGVVLWENLDVRRLVPELQAEADPRPPLPLPRAPALESRVFRAAVLDPGVTGAVFGDRDLHARAVAEWTELVRTAGGTLRRVADGPALTSLAPDEVLVLPESSCLSEAAVRAVRKHLREGGSLVATGAPGSRDADCGWRGWALTAEVAGVDEVWEFEPPAGLFVTVPGGLALGPGLDPGTRLELRPERSLTVRATDPRVYWSDWALNPVDPAAGGGDAAAALRRTAAGGRVVWFGFRTTQAATAADWEGLRVLFRNGLAWSAGLASAAPAPWPHARRAALVVAQEVEARPETARDFAALAGELALPASYFAVSRLVEGDRALGALLGEAGEVGVQTADHTPVAGLPYSDQLVRLRRARGEVERWSGASPVGLRPPEETFDRNTLRAWAAAGGEYLLAATGARTASPELHRVEEGVVTVLPRLMKDDYNVVVQDAALSSARLAEAYVAGIDKIRALGGFAAVVGHTQIMESDARRESIRAVADRARRHRDWWITSPGEAARWWSARSRVAVAFEATGDLLTLRVEVPSGIPTGAVWIDLVLPEGLGDRTPRVDGVPVEFVETDWGLRVPVAPGEAAGAHLVSLHPPDPD